jgi:hypothetical protein
MSQIRTSSRATTADIAAGSRMRANRAGRVGRAALAGLIVTSVALSTVTPAAAATETITGTATTSGGNGFTTTDFVYTSPGVLGSGTIHFDFVLIPQPPGFRTEGTGVLTRSDGATLTGTTTGTVDLSSSPFPVVIRFAVTSGTGTLSGATGEIVLAGTSRGPGVVGDVFTMTGTLTTPPPVPTDKDQCKNGGWQNLGDDQGELFRNQGQCVSFVEHAA